MNENSIKFLKFQKMFLDWRNQAINTWKKRLCAGAGAAVSDRKNPRLPALGTGSTTPDYSTFQKIFFD
jgi:hypothetical protein